MRCSSFRSALARAAACAMACATACATGGPEPTGRAEPNKPGEAPASTPMTEAYRLHTDGAARCSFPVPVGGVRISSRHFEPSAVDGKMSHEVTLSIAEQAAVRIDIFDDPLGRPLAMWFEQHLSFLVDDDSTVSTRRMTAADLEGLLIEQPRSPQVTARATAVATTGSRVFRITCLDADDRRARSLFDRLVAGLVPEVQP